MVVFLSILVGRATHGRLPSLIDYPSARTVCMHCHDGALAPGGHGKSRQFTVSKQGSEPALL
jgi:hypothetical protein